MCGRKPKVQTVTQTVTPAAVQSAPTPAASVSAPQDTIESNVVDENQQRRKRARGKKGLTIKSGGGTGTGVNI